MIWGIPLEPRVPPTPQLSPSTHSVLVDGALVHPGETPAVLTTPGADPAVAPSAAAGPSPPVVIVRGSITSQDQRRMLKEAVVFVYI